VRKYLNVFKISFAQEFAYRLNFIMWRVRNVLQILVLFFLWTTVFSDQGRVIFGYDKAKILTYVFGVLIVRALVFSARAVDVAGEISKGDLTILLLKPINYFRYWLTRDFSSKVLNLGFAVVEIAILFPLLKPAIFLQTNGYSLLGFAISLTIAVLLFFTILMATNFVAFWAPQVGWGAQFFVIVVMSDFLAGSLFPLDILPAVVQKVLLFTPFPYLIFFPIQVYLGKLTGMAMWSGIVISLFWLAVLSILTNKIWRRGLLVYRAEGR